jgi:hypothetical protein
MGKLNYVKYYLQLYIKWKYIYIFLKFQNNYLLTKVIAKSKLLKNLPVLFSSRQIQPNKRKQGLQRVILVT